MWSSARSFFSSRLRRRPIMPVPKLAATATPRSSRRNPPRRTHMPWHAPTSTTGRLGIWGGRTGHHLRPAAGFGVLPGRGRSWYRALGSYARTPGHPDTAGIRDRVFDPRAAILRCFGCHSTGPLRVSGDRIDYARRTRRALRSVPWPVSGACARPGARTSAESRAASPQANSTSFAGNVTGRRRRQASRRTLAEPWNARHQPLMLDASDCFPRKPRPADLPDVPLAARSAGAESGGLQCACGRATPLRASSRPSRESLRGLPHAHSPGAALSAVLPTTASPSTLRRILWSPSARALSTAFPIPPRRGPFRFPGEMWPARVHRSESADAAGRTLAHRWPAPDGTAVPPRHGRPLPGERTPE